MHTLCPRCRAYTGVQDLILPSWHQGPRWTCVLQIVTPLWNFLQLPSLCALFSLVPLPEAFFFSNWYIHLPLDSPPPCITFIYILVSMDRGAWWAAVLGVTKSWMWLSMHALFYLAESYLKIWFFLFISVFHVHGTLPARVSTHLLFPEWLSWMWGRGAKDILWLNCKLDLRIVAPEHL